MRSGSNETNRELFEITCKSAVQCNYCFEMGYVKRAFIDVAQPRYVGDNYWTSERRFLFMMINPGAGIGSIADQKMRMELHEFQSGDLDLPHLLVNQREHMRDWGNGKFLSYLSRIGCHVNDIALLNVAWCASEGDRYPSPMLTTCFERHTRAAIHALQPTHLIACGRKAQHHAKKSGIKFIQSPHYAARQNIDFEAIRRDIEQPGSISPATKSIISSGITHHPDLAPIGIIRLLTKCNPKSGKSFLRYACYRDGMTISEYQNAVLHGLGPEEAKKCRPDLKWDLARGFIRID